MKERIIKYSLYIVSTVLFGAFLIWALLSANGRQINLWNNESGKPTISVVQTGGIRIISEYADNIIAEVDGIQVELKENRIENIEPGLHRIKLSLNDYNDWYTNSTIKAGIVIDLNPLFLPKSLNIQTKIDEFLNIDNTFFSEHGDYVYYVVSKANKGIDNGIFKYQLSTNQSIFGNTENAPVKILNITPEIAQSIASGKYSITPSSDNRRILFYSDETGYYVFNADGNNTNQEPIIVEELLGYTPENIYWLNGSSSLVVKHQNLLSEFEIDSNRIILIDYNPNYEPIYAINGDTVVFYSKANEELFYFRNENRVKIIPENIQIPTNITKLFIDQITGSKLILESNDSYYYFNVLDSYIAKIDSDINLINFSRDGNSLTYQKNGQLISYTIEEIKPIGKFESTKNILFDNYSEDKITSFWSNSSNYIIILDKQEDGTHKLSIADRKGENIIEVLSNAGTDKPSVHVRSDNKELYVLIPDSNTEGLNNKNLYYISLFEGN